MAHRIEAAPRRSGDVPMAQNGSDPACLIVVRVIGGFGLSVRGREIDLRNRKAQAIVGHLALSAPPVQSRERLADALWSESGGEQARQSLRQTLHDLRRALGADADAMLAVRRADVALTPGFCVDLLALMDAVETADAPPEALDWAGLSDAILPGLDDLDPVFCEWLTGRRAALLARLTAALERRMAEADGEAARPWAVALVGLDPAHEPACRRLMESDAARGDVRAALKRYAALWELLDEEYAAEPSPETQELAVRLKSLEARPATVERPALTLCMGDFRLDGVPDSHGYLVRGFRQDLIALLTSYREWVVIEPGPGGQAPNADGVYEIEGVAYPARDGVRLNVTLKETAARRFIWGQQDIDLTLAQWFETCRVTTRKLAAALNVRISGDRLARTGREDDRALPLYDQLLRARDLLNHWTPEDDRRAEAIFRELLRVDPGFAPAQIGLAKLINSAHIVFPGFRRPKPGESDAVRMAQGAVEADPLDAEAQLCLGWSLAMNGRCEEAVAALAAACDANPTDPRKLASAADCLANCGADALALEKAEMSLDLDLGASRLNWGYRVTALLWSGRLDEALAAARKSDSAIPLAGGYEAAILAMMDRPARAREAWRRYADWLAPRWRGPAKPDDHAYLGWFLSAPPIADPGRRAALQAALTPLIAAQRQDAKV
jgi:DNA-binding SARP family transcriptional activator